MREPLGLGAGDGADDLHLCLSRGVVLRGCRAVGGAGLPVALGAGLDAFAGTRRGVAFWREDDGQMFIGDFDVGEGKVRHGSVSFSHIRGQCGGAIDNAYHFV